MLAVYLFFLIHFSVIHEITMCKEPLSGQKQKDFSGRIINDHLLKQKIMFSLMECFVECYKEQECMSFFFNTKSGMCSLQGMIYLDPLVASIEEGSVYYTTNIQDKCPSDNGFMHNRKLNMCYKFLGGFPVDEALVKNTCSQMGGKLVKIDNAEKQTHIVNFMKRQGAPELFTFIQGSDFGDVGNWKYDDGTQMTYFNWNLLESQPDLLNVENFISMKHTKNYLWHDVPGYLYGQSSNTVCEISI